MMMMMMTTTTTTTATMTMKYIGVAGGCSQPSYFEKRNHDFSTSLSIV